jgi:hypothetical protein
LNAGSWIARQSPDDAAHPTKLQSDRMIPLVLGQLDKSSIAELTFKDRYG